jgi:uncharacterized paraquat-inducible protein A
MTFTTKCPRCQKVVEFLDLQIGVKMRCPRCNKHMVLQVNTFSWVRWLWIPLCLVGLVSVAFVVLLLIEPGFEDAVKENMTFIKKFFSGSGPPKK